MTKLYILLAILIAFFFAACAGPSSTGDLEKRDVKSEIFACGNCEGNKTSLTLKNKEFFILKRKYLGKNGRDLQIYGNYNFNDESQIITLINISEGPSEYLLEDGKIWQLNQSIEEADGSFAANNTLADIY